MKEQSFFEKWDKVIKKMPLGKRNIWCNCEETRDEFGGCIPTEDESYCRACRKRISKNQLTKYKERMLKESGWEEEFENKIYNNGIGINESVFFQELIINYFRADDKIKIKCKDGCIQIERI